MRAVKSPMIRTAVWPASWNCRSLRRTTAWPSVEVRTAGIDPELDAERPAEGKLLLEPTLRHEVGGAAPEQARGRRRDVEP